MEYTDLQAEPMSVACASCGQIIPSGQARCSHCGALRDEAKDPRALEPSSEPLASAASVEPAAAAPRLIESAPEETAAREPLVPRGTFASELPERGSEEDEARDSAPRTTEPSVKVRTSTTASSSQRLKTVRSAPRPPYLASEILREDLTPSTPGRRLLGTMLYVAPALGIAAALFSGIQVSATWVALTALSSLLLFARLELPYATRALLVVITGGGALTLVSLWRMGLGGGYESPLLAAAATLLPAALLFRAWYRASEASRVLVAVALTLALGWALATSDRQLLSLVFSWQSWLPALAWYVFGILCLLSLLAFMGDETTAGCDIWALGIAVWYGLYAIVRFALETRGLRGPLSPNLHTLGLIEPALAAPTAVALAQLFARTLGSRTRRAVVTQ